MSKETTYIDAVTKLKDFIDEQDVFIEKVIAERDALLAKVAELENLLAEANESLNDTRVWL